MSTGKADPCSRTHLGPHVQRTTWLPHTLGHLLSPLLLWGDAPWLRCVCERENLWADQEWWRESQQLLPCIRRLLLRQRTIAGTPGLPPPLAPSPICDLFGRGSQPTERLCMCALSCPVWNEDEDEGAVSAPGPWPEEGAGAAGTRLWLCPALSVQEEAQSLPARTGRFLNTLAFTEVCQCLPVVLLAAGFLYKVEV